MVKWFIHLLFTFVLFRHTDVGTRVSGSPAQLTLHFLPPRHVAPAVTHFHATGSDAEALPPGALGTAATASVPAPAALTAPGDPPPSPPRRCAGSHGCPGNLPGNCGGARLSILGEGGRASERRCRAGAGRDSPAGAKRGNSRCRRSPPPVAQRMCGGSLPPRRSSHPPSLSAALPPSLPP